MGRLLGNVTLAGIVSRRDDLAVTIGGVIDNAIHAAGELIERGILMALTVGNGKYRAYAEGVVNVAFATNSVNFGVNPAGLLVGYFRVGDAIESTSGTALGTIATFDPSTGLGTLTANSSAALATGQSIRIAESQASLAGQNGRIMTDEVLMDVTDAPFTGYSEGFFVTAKTSLTAAAIAKLGATQPSSGEVRLH